MFLSLFFILILTGVIYFFVSSKKNRVQWKKLGVPEVQHATFLDSIKVFRGKKTFADVDQAVYNQLGDKKFCGFQQLGNPTFLAKDTEIIKKILIKDFDHFVDRRTFSSNTQPSIAKMVANLSGDEWKGVRTQLSPTFSTGKIRRMMEYFNTTANQWTGRFMDKLRKDPRNTIEIDVEEETKLYAVEVIASAVFGMNAGVIKNPDAVFATMTQKLSKIDAWTTIKIIMVLNLPKLTKLFGVKIINEEALQFFESILEQGMKARMSGAEKRNDFLQMIAETRRGELKAQGNDELSAFEKEALLNDAEVEKKNLLNDDVIAMAQLLQFFFAGFSTTSNFIGFLMYCLALNPECQEKLRTEVDLKLFKDGNQNVDYDELNKLEYLDMIACETLRKFPILGRIERKCTRDYKDSENNYEIKKGANIAIPVKALHNDPKFYKYPDKFYPEHFTAEEKAKRSPYVFLPFGTGPRNCIGMRFALVESKAAIAHLVYNFKISPAPSTPVPYAVKCVGVSVQLPNNLKVMLGPIESKLSN